MYIAKSDRYGKMQYNRLGSSGLYLPKISLGLWHNFGDNARYDDIKNLCCTAFDNGITHFDLANNYGPAPGSAEINFGKIMAGELNSHRDELVISTKAGYKMWDGPYGDGGSRKYLITSLEQSLKRLKLDYVDIFYHHRPDPNTDLFETMSALDYAVKSGKALYAGISNYDGEQMKAAAQILASLNCPFVINQNRYSIFDRTVENNGLLSCAKEAKKGIIAFSPLAQGLLSDRYLNGVPKDSRIARDGRFLKSENLTAPLLEKIKKLSELAAARSQTLAQMSLAWLLKDGGVNSVLIGASKPAQITENIKALENTEFSEEELKKIDEISLA